MTTQIYMHMVLRTASVICRTNAVRECWRRGGDYRLFSFGLLQILFSSSIFCMYQQQSDFPEIIQRFENSTQEQRTPPSPFRQQTSVAAFIVSLVHPYDLHDHTHKTCYRYRNTFFLGHMNSRPATRSECFVCGLIDHQIRTHSLPFSSAENFLGGNQRKGSFITSSALQLDSLVFRIDWYKNRDKTRSYCRIF